jgi:hypothetical protein
LEPDQTFSQRMASLFCTIEKVAQLTPSAAFRSSCRRRPDFVPDKSTLKVEEIPVDRDESLVFFGWVGRLKTLEKETKYFLHLIKLVQQINY